MKKFGVFGLIFVILVGLLGGCTNSEDGLKENNTSKGKTQIVIATGGTSGTYYAVGAGLGKLVNKYSDNLNAVVQGTHGAVENVRLVNSGEADIGFGNSDAAYFGYEGIGPFEGQKQNIVGLMSLYKSGGQMIVMEDSGYKSIPDLKGKKVNLGPAGSTVTEMSKVMFKAYGLDPEKDISPVYLSFAEGVDKVSDGDIDASFIVSGIPTAAVISVSNTKDIRLISLSDGTIEKIVKEYPYYEGFTIPGGTYKGIDEDVQSLQLWTTLIVNSDMPEEIANEITTIILDHSDELLDVHSVAKDISVETAQKMPIPLHSGSQKYFDKQ
ncbi:TAXI family TRAP transporter solute-binding subunit [Maledivibacter halophilus]|uniref:TRAP transporter solute receptor, TAXI family n=1 Tax=Maledivibacter halophilus TaxID=36842 RepID=A0A1T5IBZ4_9FIRM|nr:TAXI family TRAP transporter solute-binding subunit [Maledivibacter halophilus]SKC36600.1 hypothetical protein SAMN02194393_00172 [Maledivibacter halophilus]